MRDTVLRAVSAYADALAPVPLPNQPFAASANNALYVGTASSIRRDNHIDVKSDLRLSDTGNLSLTYSHGRPYQLSPSIYLDGAQTRQIYSERATASYVTGGPSWTSETRYGYNGNDVDNRFPGFGPQLDAAIRRRSSRLDAVSDGSQRIWAGERFPEIQPCRWKVPRGAWEKSPSI
jgi:hypothetical protein